MNVQRQMRNNVDRNVPDAAMEVREPLSGLSGSVVDGSSERDF